jgi:hypothetical protein
MRTLSEIGSTEYIHSWGGSMRRPVFMVLALLALTTPSHAASQQALKKIFIVYTGDIRGTLGICG